MSNQHLRDLLVWQLRGGGAHLNLEDGLAGIPPAFRGRSPENSPHTPWRLLEHMRIAQWDILEFSRRADHRSPPHPEGYWPEADGPAGEAGRDDSIRQLFADLEAMIRLLEDPDVDLFAEFPWGDGQNVFREALVLADHNAYHLGQLIEVRRALGVWDNDS